MGEVDYGESTFNMSLQTLKRIDSLLLDYHSYSRMEFYKGNPLFKDILSILLSIYTEVRAQLQDTEKNIGDSYRVILLERHPIRVEGDTTIIHKITISVMREWIDWLMDMLYSHKMLMSVSDDPGDVME